MMSSYYAGITEYRSKFYCGTNCHKLDQNLTNCRFCKMRTLTEWETKTLECIFALSQQILFSGFDTPQEFALKISEIDSMLSEEVQRYEFYTNQGIDDLELFPER